MTKTHKTGLNNKQAAALPLVLKGMRDSEIGAALGVARQTVCVWRNEDPVFIAELNKGRAELLDAARSKMESLASAAFDVMKDALAQGDTRAAFFVLKTLGLDQPSPVPDEKTPVDVAMKWAHDEALVVHPDENVETMMGLLDGNRAQRINYMEARVKELAEQFGFPIEKD